MVAMTIIRTRCPAMRIDTCVSWLPDTRGTMALAVRRSVMNGRSRRCDDRSIYTAPHQFEEIGNGDDTGDARTVRDDQAANRLTAHHVCGFPDRRRGRYRDYFRGHQIGDGSVFPELLQRAAFHVN